MHPPREAPPGRLEASIRDALIGAKVPGCSISVVSASGPLWSGGFGLADLRTGRPAASDTVYRLFSGTKLFTAVAVLQLEERGMLSLEDPVDRHLPEATGTRGISLLHLLTHRSGLKDTLRGFLAVSVPPRRLPTSGEALRPYQLVAARPPGRRVEYRNVNYALLGEVVTRVSGLEYRDYLERRVLGPLGMEAGFSLTDATRCRAAKGYVDRLDPTRLALRFLFPDLPRRLYAGGAGGMTELAEYDLATSAVGGLVGSMPDFGRFLQAQLAGGGAASSPRSTLRMQTQVAAGAAGVESRVGVGIGWKIGAAAGRRFLNHEGAGAGFTTELRLYPDEGIGIALGMNAMRMPKTMRLAHRLCASVVETL